MNPCGLVISSLRETKEIEDGYDEFGFRKNGTNSLYNPDTEAKQVQRWVSFLEFTIGSSWPAYRGSLPKSAHLEQLLSEGVPFSLRAQLYALIGNIYHQEQQQQYMDIYGESVKHGKDKTIEKDLLRTLPDNCYFMHLSDEGILRLRRVLNAVRHYLPQYGYCQGMGMVAGYLLLILPEERVFWMLVHILKNILPPKYYSTSLQGLRIEQVIVRNLVKQKLPRIDAFLQKRRIDLSLVSIQWLVTLFAGVLPPVMLFRVWDVMMIKGIGAIHSMSLLLLRLFEDEFISLPDSCDAFKFLAELPCRIRRDQNIDFDFDSINIKEDTLVLARKKVGDLSDNSRPKRKLLLKKDDVAPVVPNYTNLSPHLKQAEVVLSIRAAVDAICRHFGKDINTFLDYEDDKVIDKISDNNIVARCKALRKYDTTDQADLSFDYGELIEIVDQTDETFWLGRKPGMKINGWFPSDFVITLDESRMDYDAAGDLHVQKQLANMVYELLLTALKLTFIHGLKKKRDDSHPWQFMKKVSEFHKNRNIRTINQSMGRSFNVKITHKSERKSDALDEVIQLIRKLEKSTFSTMEEKFFTFILHGLSAGKLHVWWQTLTEEDGLVNDWYTNTSFVLSPGKRQIYCLLRPLSFLYFYYEESAKPTICPSVLENGNYLRDSIDELLVKHHLFSWQL